MRSSAHEAIKIKLELLDQRYTPMRRMLVETLAEAGRPFTIAEILAAAPDLPQSSAYRNLTALIEIGAVRRVAGTDDHSRFELSDDLSGSGHHHHLVCGSCGNVEDVHLSPMLEAAIAEASQASADDHGYAVLDHRLDLIGLCANCRESGHLPHPRSTADNVHYVK